jgi:glycosyltransferase involved in cell wall biosynthesis
MPSFSVNFIVKNGEKTLTSALESVKDLSDDLIIIIDSGSSDTSEEIARKFTPHVFIRKFDDFSSQRNFAISKSRHDWIFSLDADEQLSQGLKSELSKFSQKENPDSSAFYIPRQNIIFGKSIRHTNWDPDGIIRLFDKTKGSWQGQIHESWVTSGRVGKLYSPIIHHNYGSVEEFITRLNTYTTVEAEQLFTHHTSFSFLRMIWDAKYDFLRRYIRHAGFLDGWHGLYLSCLMAFYHLTVHVKLWQKSHSS